MCVCVREREREGDNNSKDERRGGRGEECGENAESEGRKVKVDEDDGKRRRENEARKVKREKWEKQMRGRWHGNQGMAVRAGT